MNITPIESGKQIRYNGWNHMNYLCSLLIEGMKRMLTLEHIAKSYGEKVLFEEMNVFIEKNDRIGLIGINGTGKSTLLKIIAGLETPDEGLIDHPKNYQIEYLDQNPQLNQKISILDYVYSGEAPIMQVLRDYEHALSQLEDDPTNEDLQKRLLHFQQLMDKHDAWEASTVAKTILTKMGVVDFAQPIVSLSGGQKKRVAIAKALIHPADLLILDEPTNHLDNDTIVWLEKHLTTYPGALLLVTHDRYFLNHVTNVIFELDHGTLYKYEGNYEVFLEKKVEREELEHRLQQKHENTLRSELAWLQRGARARSTKQRARIERIDKLKEKTFHTDKTNVEIQVGAQRLGKQVIELQSVSKTIANKQLILQLSQLITPGDRIGIIGPNGAGKTTLLELIAGRIEADSGTVLIGETVKIGYYTQGEEELDDEMRIIKYIKKVAEIIETADGTIITAEQMLERFLFSRAKQWSYIGQLSGGEKRRLYLLKILMQEPNVLLLDEPTNDLDIQTLSILEEYIEHFPGVVLTVSHDRYFLDQVVDELLIFDGNGEIHHMYGNYSDYASHKLEQEVSIVKNTTPKKQEHTKKTKTKLSYHEQKEWDTIEDDITQLEEKITVLETEIVKQGSDIEQVQLLYEEQQKVEETLEAKMERWEELSLLVESFNQ